MIEAEKSRRDVAVFWIVVFALFLLTRLPAMNLFLSIDNVNLAFALEKFDPRIHQPQPPGYPLFVLFSKAIDVVFHDAEKTFAVSSILISAMCFPLAFSMGKRLFAPWVGRAAVLLMLVSPPFWFSTLEGPLRPHLALFSLLTGYCCWRCWQGEKPYAIWGAIALGVGAGFRPDLGIYLFPLWLLSAWMGSRSVTAVLRGLAVMAAVVFAWVGGMAYVVGGFGELYKLNSEYAVGQSSRQSVVLGAAERAWLRQLSRLIIWNGTAVFASLWAVPVFLKTRERVSLRSPQSVFIVVWLLPGLLFQGLIHIEDPGHTLFSIPVLCIAGAYLIFVGARQVAQSREVLLAAALVFNMLIFLGFFPLPAPGEPAGGWRSLKNAFVFAAFETSIGELRYMNASSLQTVEELKQLTPQDRPMIIVTSDADVTDWFMNWRIVRYYAPSIDIWVIADQQTPRRVEHMRRDQKFEVSAGDKVTVPVPRGGRVIWLLEREGPFHRALKQSGIELRGGPYLSYTDIGPDMQPFRVMDVDFIPNSH